MKRYLGCFPELLRSAPLAAALLFPGSPLVANPEELARELKERASFRGGFIVHLGSGDGQLTTALGKPMNVVVHALDQAAANVTSTRERIFDAGQYGRLSAEKLGSRLPYLDGMVNLIVAEDQGSISDEELLRVLCPEGMALIRTEAKEDEESPTWRELRKPWPDTIDNWTHFLHDAGGNAVAHDSEVAPPRHLKWLGSPRWSRHHDRMASMSALVSDRGRLFYIMDEGSRISIQLPPRWKLVARDAFNGTILWKREIPDWHTHLWPLKSGPTQLARRLVAHEGNVFCTMGMTAPVSMMQDGTGETVRTFAGSDGTEELVVANGRLFLIAYKDPGELSVYLPEAPGVGDQKMVAARFQWNELPRVLMAYDIHQGTLLWSKVTRVSPLTLAGDSERCYFHDGEKVVCLNGKDGTELWHGESIGRREKVTFNFGPKLVVQDDLLFFAGGDRKMHTYEVNTGKLLWSEAHARGGYQSPEDLLVSNGLVWSAPTTSGRDSGIFTGRDIRTGEIKREFPPNVETYWFHHRCYIAKATDRFLLPSRTGIEFVDPETENWDINHWVRGGCLYGILPCNGLTYAPPHNCACYPETKLYGFNAMSASGPRPARDHQPEQRLLKGPAFGKIIGEAASASDWPAFRKDNARSGFTPLGVSAQLQPAWETQLGGRLSAITSAAGRVYLAQIDQHTLHALDAETGSKLWSFTAGGRIDSPPSYYQGALLFGSADGHVYGLRASDGALAWRFQAAPSEERHMAFEQLESVWPVHGSILIQDGKAYFVAGRSNFLDGGLRFISLDPLTGELEHETVIDEINPETGENIQDRIRTLQMPVGLPDILTYDGGYIYMKSQQFDLNGNRLELGPHSGDPAVQGSVQKGGEHLFAPMSFLDDSWFHRAYWVYGRSFAGGHGGYYQAGRHTPSGRILVFDDDNVYGFGRKPQYLKWTTTLEHQLFAASRQAPEGARSAVDDPAARRSAPPKNASMIDFGITKALDPTQQALAVETWVKPQSKDGVILARGGPLDGYALILKGGAPSFLYRSNSELVTATAKTKLGDKWSHLLAQITPDRELQLFLNGQLVARGEAAALIAKDPRQGLQLGGDDGSAVGNYKPPHSFAGLLDEVSIYRGTLTAEEVTARFAQGREAAAPAQAAPILSCSFDDGDAMDRSGHGNHGTLLGGEMIPDGKEGGAVRFATRKGSNARGGTTLVQHHWTEDIPILARAMVLSGSTLFVAGPEDLIDEEETFAMLADNDPAVEPLLARQEAALDGKAGGKLYAYSAGDGALLGEVSLPSLPTWDGMAAAAGKLILSTTDGRVISLKAK